MSSTATLEQPAQTPPSSTPPSPRQHWDAKLWALLMVLGGAILIDGLDVSMVGVAIPSVQSALEMSTSSVQWVVSGYILGYGGFLLLGGRMADLLGRRQVFLVGVAVFGVASLLSGIVDNGTFLIVARFIKGVSAALTAPAALSLLTTTFHEGPSRNRALSIFTVFGASGFSMGLIAGGLLAQLGWRWPFIFPAPIALIVFLAAWKYAPKHAKPEKQGTYDLAGAATLTGAMLLLVYTVVNAENVGWGSVWTIGSFALVAALVTSFFVIERRVAHPLVRLGILRNRTLIGANLAAVALFGAYGAFQFVTTLYMQDLLGWSPLTMALALLPAGLLVLALVPNMDKLINRFGAPRLVAVGMLAFAPGYLLFLRIGEVGNYWVVILPTVLLLGLGFATAFPGLMSSATAGIDDDEQGLASGLVQTSFQIGGAVVVAVVTAVLTANGVPRTPAQALEGFHSGLAVVAGVSVTGLLITLLAFRKRWTSA